MASTDATGNDTGNDTGDQPAEDPDTGQPKPAVGKPKAGTDAGRNT